MFYIVLCFIALLITAGWFLYKNYTREGATPSSKPNTSKPNTSKPTTATSNRVPVTAAPGADSDGEVKILNSGTSRVISEVSDAIYKIKFKSIDEQIATALDLVGQIYGKIPISIADVHPGSITTIPYEVATQNGGAHITINVLPKMIKQNNEEVQAYYSIDSTGVPLPYTGKTGKSNKATFAPQSTCSSKSGSSCSFKDAFLIVVPACIWKIDMSIPVGPKGDQGDVGQPGQIGDVGSPGQKGDSGFMGNWGSP